jgi:hypothetical protein
MTPEEKLAAAFKLTDAVLETWAAQARSEHPDADDDQIRMFVAARHLPRDLMIRAYAWDPGRQRMKNLLRK